MVSILGVKPHLLTIDPNFQGHPSRENAGKTLGMGAPKNNKPLIYTLYQVGIYWDVPGS